MDRGLARVADGPGLEQWIEVEQRTASLYMAYLAATLGPLQDLRMDPITDRTAAMAALLGLDSTAGLTLRRAYELRLSVLEELIPGPATPIDARVLKQFKDDHRPELAAFRDLVDEELLKVANFEDADARERQAEISTRRLVTERDKIVELMQRRRWPDIVFGSVAGVAAAAVGIVGGLALGGPIAAAAVAAPGLIPAVYGALKDVQEVTPDFGDRPLAYAALAQRHFGS